MSRSKRVRMRTSRSRISPYDHAPLALPYTCHTIDTGNFEKCAKNPNPAMTLCGAFNLKKNGSPGASAAKPSPIPASRS